MESRLGRDNSRNKDWPVAQLDQMYPAFNRGVVSSNLTGPTKKYLVTCSINGSALVF